jgi:hypothetical protein
LNAHVLCRTVFLVVVSGSVGCLREEPAVAPESADDGTQADSATDDVPSVEDVEIEDLSGSDGPETDGVDDTTSAELDTQEQGDDAEGSSPVTTDSGLPGPDVTPEDALDGSGGYAGQCEPHPYNHLPVASEGWSFDDLNRQCRYVEGCGAPSWSPGFECPPWLTGGQEWMCGYCWNELCIDLAENVCPEPPYHYVENPRAIDDCSTPFRRNRSEQNPMVLEELDRICAVADDCSDARTRGCDSPGNQFAASCGLCWEGRCESILIVRNCNPAPEDAWP